MSVKQIGWLALAGVLLLIGAATARSAENTRALLSPEAQLEVDLSFLLANSELDPDYLPTLLGGLLNPGKPTALQELMKDRNPIAVKAFDDLYYIGLPFVGTWVLNTRDGIILWDALDNADEAEHILVPKMKQLGLDPARIKYLIVTHGHFDHYGGAKYLQDTFHPRVLMGAADWQMIANPPGEFKAWPQPPPPRHDLDVVDGQELTLGGKTVRLYITPGHTPATVSSIIPTTFHGRPHVVAFWGGNGMPTSLAATDSTGGLIGYREQLFRFTRLGIKQHVDAVISNHPVVDGTIRKAKLMATLRPDEANPWVVGESTFIRIMGSNIAAMNAGIIEARRKIPANAPAAKKDP